MLRPLLIALTLVVIGLAPAFGRAAAQSGPQASSQPATTDQAGKSASDQPASDQSSTATQMNDITTSEKVSDSWITLKAKMALLADDKVSSTDVHVTTQKGVVTLRGKVDSDEGKQAAEADAQKIDGVQKVVNHLVVVPKSAQKAIQRKDDQIAKDVETRLKQDPTLKQASIDVHADKGIVTLSGDAPSLEASLRASEKARRVSGVRAVHNELTVQNEKKQG